MLKRRVSIILSALLVAASLQWGVGQSAYGQGTSDPPPGKHGKPTPAERREAAARKKVQIEANRKAGKPLPKSPLPGQTPDYFGLDANWAYSPQIHKFVNKLPGLTPAGVNENGQYIPVAVPDITTFANSDYYEIGLVEYDEKMHSDLPPTRLRGYVQLGTSIVPGTQELKNTDGSTLLLRGSNVMAVDKPHYLGPLIIGKGGPVGTARAVRVTFRNLLPAGAAGNLRIPMDPTYMGALMGPNSTGPLDTLNNYSQNRATLHLHGGVTPWISDGTPHQWITPADEASTLLLRGDSVAMVPDMWFNAAHQLIPSCAGQLTCAVAGATNDPGQGAQTFYWTNQQSARLMFYHDHAYGTTRLNVYAGEAAGFLITDPVEQALVTAGTIPADRVPLIIQDKTFVDAAKILTPDQDPTFIYGSTPGTPKTGDLWFPHVYNTNQNPSDLFGTNGIGRWDYGMWFWPPMSSANIKNPDVINPWYDPILAPWENLTIPAMGADPSGVPESFMDTALVNGTPYPVLHVEPKAYRFNILNAANDRFQNLQLYYAATAPVAPATTGTVCVGAAALAAACTEVNMLPATPHTALSLPLPACLPNVTIGTPGYVTNAVANPATGCWPITDIHGDSAAGWPTDGRDGGVPDPTTVGPSWVMIGNEAGFLPAPAIIDNRPVVYELARRSITVLNVYGKALFMAPAERADVLVDFTGIPAGSTLILYNDAPAPVPAFDPRVDYYTGDADMSMSTGDQTGGTKTTLPGFGPNTRTIMQIVVDLPLTTGGPLNLGTLNAALPAAFAASQPKPVVPEPVFNAAYGANFPAAYSKIQDTALTFTAMPGAPSNQAISNLTITNPGNGYVTAPTVTITPGVCGTGSGATVTAALGARRVTHLNITNSGTGYTCVPTVTLSAPPAGGVQATATAVIGSAMLPKAIHELFETNYGRMNAILAYELPFTNFQTQTTIPLAYVDPVTEIFRPDENQLWKITHNGVDTHGIHFHLFNVQIVNRVGWDGVVKPPADWEAGWKDTVVMNPLEDIIVAIRPILPVLPFKLGDSVRRLDVTLPIDATSPWNFTNIDPFTNTPTTTVNAMTNFGWEYVWHCHILGHEENDMMRPMSLLVSPAPAASLTATNSVPGPTAPFVNLAWTLPASNPAATSVLVQRATNVTFTANLVSTSLPGTPVTFKDSTVATFTTYFYRVRSENAAGFSTWSNIVTLTTVGQLPNAPTGLLISGITATSISVRWTAPVAGGGPITNMLVQTANAAGGPWTTKGTLAPAATTFTIPGLARGRTYFIRVVSSNPAGTASSNVVSQRL